MNPIYIFSIPLLLSITYISPTDASSNKTAVEAPRQTAPHVITWFFQTPRIEQKQPYSEAELYDIINTIRSSQQNFIDQRRKSAFISGIPVLYKGRLAVSNENGQIILPRLNEEDTLTIIITERPIPVITHGNTVDSWNLRNALTAVWYTYTRTVSNDQGIWTIQQQQNIPLQIPDDAIIILAPPTACIIAEGQSSADTGYNLILPDIYVRPERITHPSSLNEIAISRFLRPTLSTHAYAPEEVRYAVLTT